MNQTEGLPPACTKLLFEKVRHKLTFSEIAQHLSRDEVWTAAIFYGKATPTLKDISILADLLSLSKESLEEDFKVAGPPLRDVNLAMPTDPVIYPFHEAIALYTPAIRSVIVEKLGDGAVSGPSMNVRVERVPKGKSTNVRLVLESKFMPYQSW